MGYKTYEADKSGKITIYPSLNSPARKKRGVVKILIEKLIEVARSVRG